MFFVRCYRTGAAKSGTVNLAEWDDCPNLSDFTDTCDAHGEGKYVLFQRGKGIRGMKKVNEHIVEMPASNPTSKQNGTNNPSLADLVVFAAEEFGAEVPTVASKRTLKPSSPKSEIEECPPKDIPQKWRPKQPSQKVAFIGRHLSEAVVLLVRSQVVSLSIKL